MIYLVSNTPFKGKGVENLQLCEVKFFELGIDLASYQALIITSKNAINSLLYNSIKPCDLDVFAIGEASARACESFGFKRVYRALNSHGKEFASEIAPKLKGKKTLYIRARETISFVGDILRNGGLDVSDAVGYENSILKLELDSLKSGAKIIFTSPKNVEAFVANFGWDSSFRAIAIGEVTAGVLRSFTAPIVSSEQSIAKCVDIAKNLP